VEARERAAGDDDEDEGEERAREHRSLAARGELRDRLVLHERECDQDADREERDRADLHEGREVVPRREHHPHGQHGRDEAVDGDADNEGLGREREGVRDAGKALLDDPAADDREQEQRDADGGRLDHAPGAQDAQVDAHEERDRDRHRDRERAPGGGGERVHDDEREDREEDDHDREDGEERGDAADGPDLVTRHLAEALAVPAHGEKERHHVLDGPREDDADDDPDRPR